MLQLLNLNRQEFQHLPGRHSTKEILFLETGYNKTINNVIRHNLDDIKRDFKAKGYNFTYLPEVYGTLAANSRTDILDESSRSRIHTLTTADFTRILTQKSRGIAPMFVRYIRQKEDYDVYETAVIESSDTVLLELEQYLDHLEDKTISYGYECLSMAPTQEDEMTASAYVKPQKVKIVKDAAFAAFMMAPDSMEDFASSHKAFDLTGEASRVFHEIKHRFGENSEAIIMAMSKMIAVEPKEIVVTKTRDIQVMDSDIDFKFSPVQKAVYIFFLLHSDGVTYPQIVDYKDQLLAIYESIDRRISYKQIRSVVSKICKRNSDKAISEHCSKIRSKIRKAFGNNEKMAEFYFIQGYQGGPKFIEIARQGKVHILGSF